jgi:hypothetical protein
MGRRCLEIYSALEIVIVHRFTRRRSAHHPKKKVLHPRVKK